jgi:pilus assembly protein Flp/PilA
MKNLFEKFWQNEEGATAIEYGLIAAVMSIGILAALQSTASSVSTNFSNIASEVDAAV